MEIFLTIISALMVLTAIFYAFAAEFLAKDKAEATYFTSKATLYAVIVTATELLNAIAALGA